MRPKKGPAPGAAGRGPDSHYQGTCDPDCYAAWRRWAAKARLGRLTARQRRAVRLMAVAHGCPPERALRTLGRSL